MKAVYPRPCGEAREREVRWSWTEVYHAQGRGSFGT